MLCRLLLTLLLLAAAPRAMAGGGVTAWLEAATSSAAGKFNGGGAVQADFRLSRHLDAEAGVRFNSVFPSGLGTVKAGLTVFPSASNRHWTIHNAFLYSNYAPYPLNELHYRLSAAWHNDYLRIELGNAFRFRMGSGLFKYNLLRPLFEVRGTVRKADKVWNLSLFIRNFNRFETHGQDLIEWGVTLPVRIADRWSAFCEAYVATAGNFSGTGNYYNTNFRLGAAYRW